MKLIVKMVLLALIISLLLISTKTIAEAPKETQPAEEIPLTVKESILYYADYFKTDSKVLLKVAKCESEYNPKRVGDGGRAINIFQYHKGTWDDFVSRYQKEYKNEKLDRHSYHDQAKLTAWIFAKHPELRKRWSAYVAYKNGGTYSFYSSLLKKHYTVVCK